MTPLQLRRRLRHIIHTVKDAPCRDCHRRLPADQMSFDHIHGTKCFNLGGSMRGRTEEEVWSEIAKCEIVCIKCHRMREDKRKGLQPELEPCEVAEES